MAKRATLSLTKIEPRELDVTFFFSVSYDDAPHPVAELPVTIQGDFVDDALNVNQSVFRDALEELKSILSHALEAVTTVLEESSR